MRIGSFNSHLFALRHLGVTEKAISRSLERLSSGKRINSARDDAAGLAISSGLDAQRRAINQAIRNMNDAGGYMSTADSVMQVQVDIVQRMRELSIQAANGTLSSQDRSYLDNEFQSLLQEFDRLAMQSEFGGRRLLDGSFGSMSVQVGVMKGQEIDFSIKSTKMDSLLATLEIEDLNYTPSGTLDSLTKYSASGFIRAMAAGDINEDGNIDILSTLTNAGSISFRLGNGDGTFGAESTPVTDGSNGLDVVLSDVNSDGHLDIVRGYLSGTNHVSIRLGNGNGTFASAVTYSGGGVGIQVVDINGDSKMDILSADAGLLYIRLGNGNGTFQAATTKVSASTPYQSDYGDFNGDGKIDYVVADQGDTAPSLLLGNGDGTFQNEITFNLGTTASVAAGDINSDGKLDLVFGSSGSNAAQVMLGNGDGTFAAATTYTERASYAIYLFDMNADGHLDMIGSRGGDSTSISISFGVGNGTFLAATTYLAGSNTRSIAIADFNNDGVSDVVTGFNGETAIGINIANTLQEDLSSDDLNLLTQDQAENIISITSELLNSLSLYRAELGAVYNRLDYARSASGATGESLADSYSKIVDTDYALELAEFTRLTILQQAAVSVLQQARSIQAQIIRSLLQF